MVVDANLLLFAVDGDSPFHEPSLSWLTDALNGAKRVGLPWQSLGAFVRISTNPRALERPLSPEEAWRHVEDWLQADAAWIPVETKRHETVLGDLIRTYQVTGNLVSDAQLAALAIQHGVPVYSADTDFARFREVEWVNPLR